MISRWSAVIVAVSVVLGLSFSAAANGVPTR